jgi:hypothetical protein
MVACFLAAAVGLVVSPASAAIWSPDGTTLAGFTQTYSSAPGVSYVTDYGTDYASYSTMWAVKASSPGSATITSDILTWPVGESSFTILLGITNNDENTWSFRLGVQDGGSSYPAPTWTTLLPGQSSVLSISGSVVSDVYRLYLDIMGDFVPRPTGVGLDRTAEYTLSAASVPIPGALWLLGSGLFGAIAIGRRFGK